MKTRWLFAPAAALSLLAIPLAAEQANAENTPAAPADSPTAPTQTAQAPDGTGAETGAGNAAGDAATAADGSADATATPSFPMFNDAPFPQEPTPMPKAKEWESAQRVIFAARNGGVPSGSCEAHRLREWIRLKCSATSVGAISLLGGNSDGLIFQFDPSTNEFATFPEGAQIVFPVRRGDRRVIEWLQVSWGYRGPNSIEPFLLLSEHWLPDDEQPTISITL